MKNPSYTSDLKRKGEMTGSQYHVAKYFFRLYSRLLTVKNAKRHRFLFLVLVNPNIFM
jgi:hypothetical protein